MKNEILRYIARDKHYQKNHRIHCPEHGSQPMYGLWKKGDDDSTTGGCIKCFQELPIKESD